jgi:copper(I)-binding protein
MMKRVNVRHSSYLKAMLIFASMILVSACAGKSGALELQGAWVRAAPPGAGMTAAYGTFRNRGRDPIEITGFSSPRFEDVSLHETIQVDGRSRMQSVSSLLIGPGESASLEPGAKHLMLMGVAEPPRAGEIVVITVQTADGRSFSFEVPVERR